LINVALVFTKGKAMEFMVVDAVTDEIVEINFEYKTHAEMWIEVFGKNYPNAELVVELA
jgi:hypothetical protein